MPHIREVRELAEYCPYCMNPVTPDMPCKNCGLTAGNYAPAPHHLPPGTVLRDRYLIGRVLGEGGFGITYIGCDLQLEIKVAIKEYFPVDKSYRISSTSLSVTNYSGSLGQGYEGGKRRFLQEARTMARLDKQPVIVSAKDFFEANNTAYIVMEYVEGTTIKELVSQRGGKIPVDELFRIMEPMFSALTEMHNLGLIHRDISPENLMLEHGKIRLLDFGCARESADGNATMTIALKHGYAPIEQYQHKGQGPWTDVYALSATIYYCLTGKKPPQATDRIMEDELILPRKLGIELTEKQERALLYGMGCRPRHRFRSAEELHAALYNDDAVLPEDALHTVPLTEQVDVGTTHKPEDEPAKEETQQQDNTVKPEEEQEKAEEQENKPKRRKAEKQPKAEGDKKPDKKELYSWLAAIAALVVLVVAFVPKGSKPAENEAAPADVVEIGAEEAEGIFATFPAEEDYTQAYEWGDILNQLNDDGVKAITIPSGTYIETMDAIELTKPLRIEQGARLQNFQPLIVASEGLIIVEGEGHFINEGMLQTAGEGIIVVKEHGWFDNSVFFWMQNEGGLRSFSENVYLGEEHVNYMTFDEESTFRHAVHVDNEMDYIHAVNDPGTYAIVIDGDLTLNTNNRYIDKPVKVSEGVTVTANPREDASWCFGGDARGVTLVNYGTIIGEVNNLDFGNNAFINYGNAQAYYYLGNEHGVFINKGEWTANGGQANGGIFINLNKMNFVWDGEEYNNWYSFNNRLVYNHGDIELTGSDSLDHPANMELSDGVAFYNEGNMIFHENACMNNHAFYLNLGGTYFNNAETTWLDNLGMIEVYNTGDLQVHPDNTRCGNRGGAIFYYESEDVKIPDTRVENHVLPVFAEADAHDEAELRSLLADESVRSIRVANSIAVEGDLEVNKGLFIQEGGLTVNNGDLIIRGETAYVIDWHCVELGGELKVLDGGIYTQMTGGESHLNNIEVSNGATALFRSSVFFNDNSRNLVDIHDGGWMIPMSYLSLENADVTINAYGELLCSSYVWMGNSNVNIGENGWFRIFLQLEMDESSTIINGHAFDISSPTGAKSLLNGTVENHSMMDFHYPPSIIGKVINYGRIQTRNGENGLEIFDGGELVNDGEILLFDDAWINGTVTGNQPVQGTEWDYGWNY